MTLQTVFQFLARRRTAYTKTFRGNAFADEVLLDLSKFCRAASTTFHDDPRQHARAEGRRDVFLRIQAHIQLTDEELWALYDGRPIVGKPTD